MGRFDRLGSVEATGGAGSYFSDGTYIVELNRVCDFDSRKGEGQTVVIECTVLKVLAPMANSNAPGAVCSQVLTLGKTGLAGTMAWGNLKAFVATLAEMDPNDKSITDKKWAEAADLITKGDGTVFAGHILKVTAVATKTKAGKDFTKIMWSSMDDEALAAHGLKQAA